MNKIELSDKESPKISKKHTHKKKILRIIFEGIAFKLAKKNLMNTTTINKHSKIGNMSMCLT